MCLIVTKQTALIGLIVRSYRSIQSADIYVEPGTVVTWSPIVRQRFGIVFNYGAL